MKIRLAVLVVLCGSHLLCAQGPRAYNLQGPVSCYDLMDGCGQPLKDTRPIAYAYTDLRIDCPDCDYLKTQAHLLPVQLVWRQAPSWVTRFPTLHYRGKGSKTGWWKWSGWDRNRSDTLQRFKRAWAERDEQRFLPITVFRPTRFSTATQSYPVRGGHWSFPGRTREALIRHLQNGQHRGKFSRVYLRGLSYEQLRSLHDDDHEGRVKWQYVRNQRVAVIRQSSVAEWCPT